MSSPPTATHHNIVALEGCITPIPDFTPAMPPGHTFTLTIHHHTPHADQPLVQSRLANADIAITTVCPLSTLTLSPSSTPYLRFIAVMASGHDVIAKPASLARGIVISNSPSSNVDAVDAWLSSPDGERPLPMREEVVGILGHGAVGKRIAELCRALGMKSILVSGRKGAAATTEEENGRTGFEEVIRTASVLFLCVPRTPETMGLLSTGEFEAMQPHALVVNVSRGGVVDEKALAEALKSGKIAGAATDVFEKEPAGPENSVLLGEDTEGLNLVTTPHVAWASRETTQNYQDTVIANLKAFLEQKPQNVVS